MMCHDGTVGTRFHMEISPEISIFDFVFFFCSVPSGVVAYKNVYIYHVGAIFIYTHKLQITIMQLPQRKPRR